jgi:hypothetical protein
MTCLRPKKRGKPEACIDCNRNIKWTADLPLPTQSRRPVSRTRSDPALSNGAAGLQDTEMGTGRNEGGQFESSFNLTAQR